MIGRLYYVNISIYTYSESHKEIRMINLFSFKLRNINIKTTLYSHKYSIIRTGSETFSLWSEMAVLLSYFKLQVNYWIEELTTVLEKTTDVMLNII